MWIFGQNFFDRQIGHIGHDDVGAVGEQMPDEVPSDLADAGDSDPLSLQRIGAPGGLGHGPHPVEDAQARSARWSRRLRRWRPSVR